jgi:hypothetical protein
VALATACEVATFPPQTFLESIAIGRRCCISGNWDRNPLF